MSKIKSLLQLDQKVIINASQEQVWNVFNDQSLLSKWTTDVQRSHYKYQMAKEGEVRKNDCIVNGKEGTITTRCIYLQGYELAEFVVEDDSFGMNKMLGNVSFASVFRKVNTHKTEFVMKSYYKPNNLFSKLLNGLVIRPKMKKEVKIMLNGLKDFVETGQINMKNPINQ